MTGFWDRSDKANDGDARGIASLKGGVAAFALVVFATVGLVVAPLIGHGSLASFGLGGAAFFAGIVGFVEILKRGED